MWWALSTLRSELLLKGLPMPQHLEFVRATVLLHSTPVGDRQVLAGDSQFAQSSVEPLRLSEFCALLLSGDVATIPEPERRLAVAIRKSGYDRTKRVVCPAPFPALLACHE